MFDLDETLSRSTAVGSATHFVIAALARATLQPTLAEIRSAVDQALGGFRPIEARAHRQNIAGCVQRYFLRCLPPHGFTFADANHDLGIGRVDLVWIDDARSVLVDEIKTGHPRTLRVRAAHDQIERYREAGRSAWGDQFIGIRLLSVTEPATSLFCDPEGHRVPLISTPYLKKRS